ncbi:MAG: ABC transporter substrate-binding protein [Gammaproteobacteria bacterium]|nr:ABC transporter substrate-binding protein [Gammaproteobacteria bacterium]
MDRRKFIKNSAVVAGTAAVATITDFPYFFVKKFAKAAAGDTIKVGILHSLSGTIAIIERSLHNAELLAIDEINAAGGVMGKMIEPVIEDTQSMVQVFADKAKKLILEDKVVAVLGCYTSASRQSVLPVFEQYNNVLLYPTLYEAQECSKNCFYTGCVPNQQLDDFVPWLIENVGPKFYMIGSNYIYPKETNREVKALLKAHGGIDVGEEYAPLGHTEFSTNINKIVAKKPDVVFSDLVGDSVIAFYKQFAGFGLTADDIIIATPITTEQETLAMGPENGIGHLTSFNYFQSVDTPENKKFVTAFKAKYGKNEVTNAVMEAAYFQTFMLAQALEKTQSTDADALIFEGLPGQEYQAPGGLVKIDEKNHHTWLWPKIGRANEEGQFDIIWERDDWVRPDPWVDLLYPNKDCDFTNPGVLERLKSDSKDRSGTLEKIS